jgi:hypothetical protein
VIHEVDEALRTLIKERALAGSGIEVQLEAPTKEWAARRNAPTVNMYLYDIREDLRRRELGRINEYDGTGRVTARHRPPRYMKLSYLVTAWTQRPEDEHRLLSAMLVALLADERLPPSRLTGTLAGLGLPVPMTVALPPPEDRAFADVWTALGGELKPSLDVVISVPVSSAADPAASPVTEELRADMIRMDLPGGPRGTPPSGTPEPGGSDAGPGQPPGTGPGQPSGTGPGQPSGTGPGQPSGTGPGQPSGTGAGEPAEAGPGQPAEAEAGQPSGPGSGQAPSPGPAGRIVITRPHRTKNRKPEQ